MIRFVLIAFAVIAIWLIAMQAIRYFKTRQIDWTGVTFAVGFVSLAFYLRAVTGIG